MSHKNDWPLDRLGEAGSTDAAWSRSLHSPIPRMEYKGHLIVVAVVGALGIERWQVVFSVHKTTARGLECVYRCDEEKCYPTREQATDAGFRSARAWVDETCRVN